MCIVLFFYTVSAPDILSLRSPRPLPSPVCLHDFCIDTMCRNFHPKIFVVVTMAPAIGIGNYIYTQIYMLMVLLLHSTAVTFYIIILTVESAVVPTQT